MACAKLHKGNNLSRLKQSNQSAIRKIIYLQGPVLRSSIAENLHLTLPTITTNVNSMLQNGIIFEDKENIVMTPGRFALPVDIAPNSRYFIGIEITETARKLCISNYRGTIVYSDFDYTFFEQYQDAVQSAAELITTALKSSPVPVQKIHGIGVCIPGLVDSNAGKLLAHRQYGWYDKDVIGDLRSHTGYRGPMSIENDASARALASQLFLRKQMQNISSFFYLYVSIGIASPFIENDYNLSSSPVGAGELGYMIMDLNMPLGPWGSTGSLNNLAGMRALKEHARQNAAEGKAPYLHTLCGDEQPNIAQIMESAEHDGTIDELVSKVVFYLGVAIANEDNLVRPHSILVDAPYFSYEKYRRIFIETIYKYSFRPSSFRFNVIFIEPDEINGPKSGAAVAIRNDFNEYIEA